MGNNESTITARLEKKPVVVIVGGGYGGIKVAKELDEHCNVVLIDRKNYFFHNIGALRATVDPSFAKSILIPYNSLLKYGYVVQAEVTQIKEKEIIVHGRDEPIKFDYLVIATGSNYAFPCKIAIPNKKDVHIYEETSAAIEKANKIVIIGGGPVGVELTGEIFDKHPNKSVTIIHSHDKLVQGNYVEKLQKELLKKLTDLGDNVKVILGERAIIDSETLATHHTRFVTGERVIETDKGTKVQADLVFFCGGSKVNSSSYSSTFSVVLDEHKRLKVNNLLQVEGYKHIFALGDCSNVPDPKTSFAAGLQGAYLGNLIKQIIENESKGNKNVTLKEYKPVASSMICIPIGSKKGASQLPGEMVVGSFLTSMIKGRDLFASNVWAEMNLKINQSNQSSTQPDEKKKIARMTTVLKIGVEEAQKFVDGLEPEKKSNLVDYT